MQAAAIAGGIAVVIDVLRASTTISVALAAGAAAIVSTPTVDAARRTRDRLPAGALLGGERGGTPPGGFDLGNSPLEYTSARVAGRVIVLTTTNGTAALEACHTAAIVVVGAIVNRRAVARFVQRTAFDRGIRAVHLVCAGTDGRASSEDMLGAGAILDAAGRSAGRLDSDAAAALAAFRDVSAGGDTGHALTAAFRTTPGGTNLLALGMERDLRAAALIDSVALVPVLEGGRLIPRGA